MVKKSIRQINEKQDLTLWNWTKKVLFTLIFMFMSGVCIYDNASEFAALFAFIAGCKIPGYLDFTKKVLRSKGYNV